MMESINSLAFLHDAARCLALAQQGQLALRSDRSLHYRAKTLLAAHTMKGHVQHEGREGYSPRLDLLWRLLRGAGLLAVREGRLYLTDRANWWLEQAFAEQLDALAAAWHDDPSPTWTWLREASRREGTMRYWPMVLDLALGALRRVPPGQGAWLSDLRREIMAQIEATRLGRIRRLPQVQQGRMRRTERVLDFLFTDVLPSLGAVDLRFGESDCLIVPLAESATNPAGAWQRGADLLDIAGVEPLQVGEEIAPDGPTSAPLSVSDDLTVEAPAQAPIAWTFDLAHMAELLSPGPPARYRITEASWSRAVAMGYTPTAILAFLARCAAGPALEQDNLPPAARATLEAWREERVVVACQPGYRLRFADGAVLQGLRRRGALGQLLQPLASGHDAWVARVAAGAAFRALRRAGHTLAPAPEEERVLWPPWPGQRAGLPHLAILTALGAYRLLRRNLPALAELDDGALEHTWTASLAPAEAAALRRLLASHAAALQARFGDLSLPAAAPPIPEPEDAMLARLQAAIRDGATLTLTYVDTRTVVTQRTISPLRLEERWGQCYLYARGEGQAERCFRLDRIIALEEKRNHVRLAASRT